MIFAASSVTAAGSQINAGVRTIILGERPSCCGTGVPVDRPVVGMAEVFWKPWGDKTVLRLSERLMQGAAVL